MRTPPVHRKLLPRVEVSARRARAQAPAGLPARGTWALPVGVDVPSPVGGVVFYPSYEEGRWNPPPEIRGKLRHSECHMRAVLASLRAEAQHAAMAAPVVGIELLYRCPARPVRRTGLAGAGGTKAPDCTLDLHPGRSQARGTRSQPRPPSEGSGFGIGLASAQLLSYFVSFPLSLPVSVCETGLTVPFSPAPWEGRGADEGLLPPVPRPHPGST